MATVTKTWTFASSKEDFVEVGDSNVQFLTNFGGYPSSSCITFSLLGYSTNSERARTGTGVTWETWGVPSGATINNVNATIYLKRGSTTGWTTTFAFRILNSSNSTIHSAGDIISAAPTLNSWVQFSGTQRNIDASYTTSTTAVKAEMYAQIANGSTTNRVLYVDTIELTIDYTAGSSFTAKARRIFSNLINRVGSRTVK